MAFADQIAFDSEAGHWEFYRQCQAAELASADDLFSVTRAYEIVLLSEQDVTESVATEAVTAVTRIFEEDNSS